MSSEADVRAWLRQPPLVDVDGVSYFELVGQADAARERPRLDFQAINAKLAKAGDEFYYPTGWRKTGAVWDLRYWLATYGGHLRPILQERRWLDGLWFQRTERGSMLAYLRIWGARGRPLVAYGEGWEFEQAFASLTANVNARQWRVDKHARSRKP